MQKITQRFGLPRAVEFRLAWGDWVSAQLDYWHRGQAGRWVGGITFLPAGERQLAASCVPPDHCITHSHDQIELNGI